MGTPWREVGEFRGIFVLWIPRGIDVAEQRLREEIARITDQCVAVKRMRVETGGNAALLLGHRRASRVSASDAIIYVHRAGVHTRGLQVRHAADIIFTATPTEWAPTKLLYKIGYLKGEVGY